MNFSTLLEEYIYDYIGDVTYNVSSNLERLILGGLDCLLKELCLGSFE